MRTIFFYKVRVTSLAMSEGSKEVAGQRCKSSYSRFAKQRFRVVDGLNGGCTSTERSGLVAAHIKIDRTTNYEGHDGASFVETARECEVGFRRCKERRSAGIVPFTNLFGPACGAPCRSTLSSWCEAPASALQGLAKERPSRAIIPLRFAQASL